MAEPSVTMVDFLRSSGILTDYNSTNRTGGSNYIFPDKPLIETLGKNSYPRIGVEPLAEPSTPAGSASNDMIATVGLQITIYTYYKVFGSNNQQGQHLVDTIGRDIVSALRQNWRTHATTKSLFFDFEITDNRPLPYDEARKLFKRRIDVTLLMVNPGET